MIGHDSRYSLNKANSKLKIERTIIKCASVKRILY